MRTYRTKRRHLKKRSEHIRRMIFFAIIFAILIVWSIWNYSRTVSAHDSHSEHSIYYKSIEVKAGDTLWDIAEEYMDDGYSSVSEYMNELIEINQLGSGRIHEGRYLTIVYRL